jgi:hypothetical protein
MTLCKGCSLAEIQHHSLSSINRVLHHHFTYDTALKNLHCGRPNPSAKLFSYLTREVGASRDGATHRTGSVCLRGPGGRVPYGSFRPAWRYGGHSLLFCTSAAARRPHPANGICHDAGAAIHSHASYYFSFAC